MPSTSVVENLATVEASVGISENQSSAPYGEGNDCVVPPLSGHMYPTNDMGYIFHCFHSPFGPRFFGWYGGG